MNAGTIADYLSGVVIEGVVIGVVFWVLTYLIMESTSLWGALRAALIAEVAGNVPYLFGLQPTDPLSLLATLVAAVIFVRLILRVGELTLARAVYGTTMTYFVLVAIVACS